MLGDDADALIRYWGVDRGPNFEGRSILYVEGGDIDPEVLARARQRLYDVRSQRVWPGLDDKRLTAWNALMLAALADAGAVLGRADYLDAARQCAEFLTEQMRDADGRLLRTYKDGRASLNAYLEDHAFLSEALLVLYEATLETRWFVEARALADDVVLRFRDAEGGGFFDTASDHESLVVRPRSFEDHPIPSGQLVRRLRAAADLRGHRRPRLRAAGGRGVPRSCTRPPCGIRRRSVTCSRRCTSTSPRRARWRSWASSSTSWPPWCTAASTPPSCWRECGPATTRRSRRSRCCAAASRWTGGRPPTCARTSPAGCPSPIRQSWSSLLA